MNQNDLIELDLKDFYVEDRISSVDNVWLSIQNMCDYDDAPITKNFAEASIKEEIMQVLDEQLDHTMGDIVSAIKNGTPYEDYLSFNLLVESGIYSIIALCYGDNGLGITGFKDKDEAISYLMNIGESFINQVITPVLQEKGYIVKPYECKVSDTIIYRGITITIPKPKEKINIKKGEDK